MARPQSDWFVHVIRSGGRVHTLVRPQVTYLLVVGLAKWSIEGFVFSNFNCSHNRQLNVLSVGSKATSYQPIST